MGWLDDWRSHRADPFADAVLGGPGAREVFDKENDFNEKSARESVYVSRTMRRAVCRKHRVRVLNEQMVKTCGGYDKMLGQRLE